MIYIRFEGAPAGIEQQLIAWIKWAVLQGTAPEGLVLEPTAELALRAGLSELRKACGVPCERPVTRFYGLPVRIGERLRPREVVLECGYPIRGESPPGALLAVE